MEEWNEFLVLISFMNNHVNVLPWFKSWILYPWLLLSNFMYKFTVRISQEEFSKVSVVEAHEEAVTFSLYHRMEKLIQVDSVTHWFWLIYLSQVHVLYRRHNSLAFNFSKWTVILYSPFRILYYFLLNHIRKYKDHLSYTTARNKIYYELPKDTEV